MTARLFVTLTLVLGAVAFGELLGSQGWRLYGDVAQAVAGAAAAWVCLAVAGRRTGVQRRWRRLAGFGLVVWVVIRLWWLVRDVVEPDRVVTEVADIGFLALPLCMLAGVLSAPYSRPRPVPTSPRRDQIALIIDSVLIAGSLLALAWSAVPEQAMRWAGQPTALIAMAAAFPIADLVVLTMVVLLLATRPGTPTGRQTLRLLGLAVLSFGVTDTLRLINLAALPLTPLESAGHLLGPAFMALAATTAATSPGPQAPSTAERDWLHLLLPYVPVTATGIVIAINTGAGNPLSPFEAYLGWLGLGLVVARQMFTIVDNTVLLDRVSEGQRRLHHQAYHDPLTGLANRALFHERLVAALDAHRQRGKPLAVLFADLDDFKLINDSFGHAMGDRVLHAVAERLQGCVTADDLVARLGGDEFAVLFDHRPSDAEPAGHRILAALREPLVIDGRRIGVGASIGLVAPDPAEPLSADALLRRADAAMYASKRRGKGALARYAGVADGGPNADLPHLLAQALATGGQPAAAGFDVFVTVAERTGQVAAIDDFVLDQACADAAALAVVYGRPIDVHVNVSAARLGRAGLEEAVRIALTRHGLPPSRLVVEITETQCIQDLPAAAAATARLRSLGIRIALDDLGSGFNALAQLHSLPLDIVKLDAALTDVDVAPDRAGALCRSILAICDDLGIVVVAEGIESPGRAAALAELGCPLGQGYLFGLPSPMHRLQSPASPAPRPPTSLQQLT